MVNLIDNVIYILSYLILFLTSLKVLTNNLINFSSNKIKTILRVATKTNTAAFIVGIITTMICQSSNAITVITLALISSKYISFKKGLVIIIGSNVGTTCTSFLISLDIYHLVPLFLILGFILFNSNKNKNIGCLLLSLGFLFFSLELLINKLESFLSIEYIYPFINSINNSSFFSFLCGIFLSSCIQSSSAAIGIFQGLYQKDILSLAACISFVLGANIGTTLTGVISSFTCSNETKKVAIINLLFNLFGSVLFLLILIPYSNITYVLSNILKLNKKGVIALSHLLYNLLCSFFFFVLFNNWLKKETVE